MVSVPKALPIYGSNDLLGLTPPQHPHALRWTAIPSPSRRPVAYLPKPVGRARPLRAFCGVRVNDVAADLGQHISQCLAQADRAGAVNKGKVVGVGLWIVWISTVGTG